MDGGAWCVTVHGVAKSWARLRDLTFTFTLSRKTASPSLSGPRWAVGFVFLEVPTPKHPLPHTSLLLLLLLLSH